MNVDKLLYYEISNINLIKALIDVFSKTSEEIRLNFVKSKINKVLLEISCTNITRTFFLKGKFNHELLQKFYCDNNNFEIIINPNDLVEIFKSIEKSDNLVMFYITKDEPDNMVVEFVDSVPDSVPDSDPDSDSDSDSKSKSKSKSKPKSKSVKSAKLAKVSNKKQFSLGVVYPTQPEKQLTKISFDKKITINPSIFHKTCKDLGSLFDYVKICSKNNKSLSFSYNTDGCDGFNSFKFDDLNVVLEDLVAKNPNVSGIYCLEDINMLAKLSDYTTQFYFSIGNNFLLESTYIFGNSGSLNSIFVSNRDDYGIKNLSWQNELNKSDNSDNLSNLSDINNIEDKSKNVKKTIDDKIIYLEINNTELFRNMCDCVSKVVSEPVFTLECVQDDMVIKINCSNSSKNIFMDLKLTNIFERFKSIDKAVELGIQLDNLCDVLKTLDKTDRLVLSVDKNDKHNLTIQIKNKENKNIKKIYKIKLLNVENNPVNFTKDYAKKIKIEQHEFYKICKEINGLGREILNIDCSDKNIIFSCMEECKYVNIYKNDNTVVKIIDKTNGDRDLDQEIESNNDNDSDSDSDSKIKISKTNNKILTGAYEIKDVSIFGKMVNYMDNFEILLKNDNSLIVKTSLTNLSGSIVIQYLSKNKYEIVPNDLNMVKSDIDSMDNKLIFFKLKKISFMKNIIDTIDKMISDVDWVFNSGGVDGNEFVGLEITCTDPSKNLYVKAKLTNELFKSYHCAKKIFKFGMSLEFFNKILRFVEKDDIAIYCYIENSDPDNLIIRFKNLEKKNKKIFKIPLQILSGDLKPPVTLSFEKKINVQSNKFLEKCKIINNRTQFVELLCDGEKIIFNCVGDKDGTVVLSEQDDNQLDITSLDNKSVGGTYEIKNILLFSKFSTITENFSIYMKNNFALTSNFSFGELGSITTILSHVGEEYINNLTYDYSDDEDEIELIKGNSNILEFN